MGAGLVHSNSYYNPAPQFIMHNAHAFDAAPIGTDGLNDSVVSYDYSQLGKLTFMGTYASVAATIATDGLSNSIAFFPLTPVDATFFGASGIIIFFATDTHASVTAAISTDGLNELIIFINVQSFSAAVIVSSGIRKYFIFRNIVQGSMVHMMVFEFMNFTPFPNSPHTRFILQFLCDLQSSLML